MVLPESRDFPRMQREYVRTPEPLYFPTEEEVPETKRHRKLANLLFEIIERAFEGRALVACDQFLYWDPAEPGKKLAPDVAARLGACEGERLDSWKTWRLGAPEVGVEIVSASDQSELVFAEKLARYRQAGVLEVVRFDPESVERPLRLWDLLDGDLVERELGRPEALFCDALGAYWCVVREPKLGPALRLATDPTGQSLLPTPEEAERAAKEAERAAKEAERAAKEAALDERDRALSRIAELEAELQRR
jgi:Uma2 family endonuclease